HGDASLLLNGEYEAALRRTIQLGEHQPRHARMLDERLGLGKSVLPGGRIEHEQHLGDLRLLLDDSTNLRQLIHETALRLQATGSVDEHDVDPLANRQLDGLEGYR